LARSAAPHLLLLMSSTFLGPSAFSVSFCCFWGGGANLLGALAGGGACCWGPFLRCLSAACSLLCFAASNRFALSACLAASSSRAALAACSGKTWQTAHQPRNGSNQHC